MKLTLLLILILTANTFSQKDSLITYFESGKISSVVHLRDNVRDGDAQFNWENGNIKEELTYINGRVEGLVRRYDTSGVLREMFSIENGKREGPTSLFDSTGTYIEDIYYEEGILVVDKIVLDDGGYDKVLVSNEISEKQNTQTNKKGNSNNPLPPDVEEAHNYEDDPAFYKSVELMPEPIGGMNAIYRKLSYPKEAKENNIEGIGYGCDESARLAIYYHRFKPGMQRGQRIKVQLEIPIEFKLPKEEK
jgi:antitoxin component YwqK of YwqJK toxin-antitoxin module